MIDRDRQRDHNGNGHGHEVEWGRGEHLKREAIVSEGESEVM